jgi:glycerol kinase
LQVKAFSSLKDIEKAWKCESRFKPKMGKSERQKLYAGWQHAVKQALA